MANAYFSFRRPRLKEALILISYHWKISHPTCIDTEIFYRARTKDMVGRGGGGGKQRAVFRLANPKGGNCLLEKQAVTSFWLCRIGGIDDDCQQHVSLFYSSRINRNLISEIRWQSYHALDETFQAQWFSADEINHFYRDRNFFVSHFNSDARSIIFSTVGFIIVFCCGIISMTVIKSLSAKHGYTVVLNPFYYRLNHCYWEGNVCLNIKICKCLVWN